MQSFDLIDRPWIPCVPLASSLGEAELLGIRTVFQRAHEIREISDPSPLIVGSLHRLLLAILHRALDGPRTDAAWAELLAAGQFAGHPAIDDYLDRMQAEERFDLFHPERPFYQTPGIRTAEPWPVAKLFPELDASAFDHTLDGPNLGVSPAAAARALVSMQTFALGGLVSFDDPAHRSADGAPLANCAMVLLRGETLFETLVLGLVRYDRAHGRPFPTQHAIDLPAWERAEPTIAGDRSPTGYVDWLTWQSRRLLLGPPDPDAAHPVVRHVVVMKGFQLPDPEDRRRYETMVAFRAARNAKPDERPHLPVKFDADRALWRDFTAFCAANDTTRERPVVMRDLSDARDDMPAERRVVQTDVLGMLSDRALKILWRSERFDLPLEYLTDEELVGRLGRALRFANEDVGRLFLGGYWHAGDGRSGPRPLQLLAERLLPAPGGDADKRAVDALIASIGMERRFWPRLETPFRALVLELAGVAGAKADGGEPWMGALERWVSTVGRHAREVFDETTAALGRDGRTLRAVAPARNSFHAGLWRAERRFRDIEGLPSFVEGDAA